MSNNEWQRVDAQRTQGKIRERMRSDQVETLNYMPPVVQRRCLILRRAPWVLASVSGGVQCAVWAIASPNGFPLLPLLVFSLGGAAIGGSGAVLSIAAMRGSVHKGGLVAAFVLNVVVTLVSLATAALAGILVGDHGC
jgi:hypothetical protein